jgi:hypothetical protein
VRVRGRQIGADAVQPGRVTETADTVPGDIGCDFHHHFGLYEGDGEGLSGAPPSGERPPCPWMSGRGRDEQPGQERAGRAGQRGGAAGVLRELAAVEPAQQQAAGSGKGPGDRADDRLLRLAPPTCAIRAPPAGRGPRVV